jgi:hypothetical protein
MNGDDRDLYEAFALVRRREEAMAPPFGSRTLSARRAAIPSLRGRLIAATACLAFLLAAVVWLVSGSRARHPHPQQAAASITTWKPATDFLLDTPGRQVLYNVPSIGQWSGAMPQPSSARPRRPRSKFRNKEKLS